MQDPCPSWIGIAVGLKAVSCADAAPLYESVCSQLGWTPDSGKLEGMKAANEKELEKLEASVKDAEENLGDIEVRDSHLAKAEHLYRIGESHHHTRCGPILLHSWDSMWRGLLHVEGRWRMHVCSIAELHLHLTRPHPRR